MDENLNGSGTYALGRPTVITAMRYHFILNWENSENWRLISQKHVEILKQRMADLAGAPHRAGSMEKS